jgi:hypothetical protein
MKYTDRIKYISPPTFSGEMCMTPKIPERIKIDADNPIYDRAAKTFSQRGYLYPSPPVFLGEQDVSIPDDDVFVLRMPFKVPGSAFCLPVELSWAASFVWSCVAYQKLFPEWESRFFYLTIRSGEVSSQQDDTFHVDGFQGVLVPRHLPEQIYLWTDRDPTHWAIQPFFCEDLDPAKHNIHNFFDQQTNRQNLYCGVPKGVYCFDPYHVHARPVLGAGLQPGRRTVLRVSSIPIEIRDDTNTQNPAITMPIYDKADPRNNFWNYPVSNPEIKFGLNRVL